MKIKSKYVFTLVLTLMLAFGGVMITNSFASAATDSADAVVNVVPACTFSAEDATTTIPTASGTVSNSESISTKPDIETTCNALNGWKIQAIGYSPDSSNPTGADGNTSMYSPVSGGTGNFIATGTSGTSSYWSMKISIVSASSTTTGTVLNSFNSYSNVPSLATNVANFAGSGTGTSLVGVIRADYQIFVDGGQSPGTYTGKVKYTIAVNP